MEYTVKKLAQISGVSPRTLRYYDEIGLLPPLKLSSNGYRMYGEQQVDTLQQILFYRELGISLDEIKNLIFAPGFDRAKALSDHLEHLISKKDRVEKLIINVRKTIEHMKGEIIMSDEQKFEGFKRNMIEENEQKYGEELREKYGDKVMDASNSKIKNMTIAQMQEQERISNEINSRLAMAIQTGDPSSELAQTVCDLHRQWICMFWPDRTYTKQAHQCLGEMYVADERFAEYYNKIAPGSAEFLRDALNIYCK